MAAATPIEVDQSQFEKAFKLLVRRRTRDCWIVGGPLPWAGLEKTEEHREIVAALQNPCELISQLHRQPLALDVHVEDARIDHAPIDGRGLAVGKDDAAAHETFLSARYHEALAGEVLGVTREHLGDIIGRQRHILPPLSRRQLRAIAAQREKRDPLDSRIPEKQLLVGRRRPTSSRHRQCRIGDRAHDLPVVAPGDCRSDHGERRYGSGQKKQRPAVDRGS